jgi:hypothetical protein
MLKAILCNKSVSRVEIDQRARDARLRLDQIGNPAWVNLRHVGPPIIQRPPGPDRSPPPAGCGEAEKMP